MLKVYLRIQERNFLQSKALIQLDFDQKDETLLGILSVCHFEKIWFPSSFPKHWTNFFQLYFKLEP